MSNSDRVALVLGGAGTVGSGIAKGLLDKGFKVVAVSRDGSKLEKLKVLISPSRRENLLTVEGDIGSEEGAEQVKQALLTRMVTVTDVVSSLGFSWWQGGAPTLKTSRNCVGPPPRCPQVLDALLFSTFVSWKAFFPLVRDNPKGTYTFITGGAADRLLMPGTGFLTVGAASALAFCQVLQEEYPDTPCKFNQVRINTGVTSTERKAPGYLCHLELGQAVALLVEKGNPSHSVHTINCPDDLKTIASEERI